MQLSESLRTEYVDLYQHHLVRSSYETRVNQLVDRILEHRVSYETVSNSLHIPWYVIAVIHAMESSLDFRRHLHNGDPLTGRTVHVPAGRPMEGTPPFSWEVSAIDALRYHRFNTWTDWSVAGSLYKLEGYNGWGYRQYHPHVLTPYLWRFSDRYSKGKYGGDGKFDPELMSDQCGAAVLLRRLAERNPGEVFPV